MIQNLISVNSDKNLDLKYIGFIFYWPYGIFHKVNILISNTSKCKQIKKALFQYLNQNFHLDSSPYKWLCSKKIIYYLCNNNYNLKMPITTFRLKFHILLTWESRLLYITIDHHNSEDMEKELKWLHRSPLSFQKDVVCQINIKDKILLLRTLLHAI